jgi:dTDP-4-dehydrorhamnose 3,5-epimerase
VTCPYRPRDGRPQSASLDSQHGAVTIATVSPPKADATGETSARKDAAHIDRDWVVDWQLIDGVRCREVRNVVTANGITTELYRPDWGMVEGSVEQAIHVALRGNAVSAWHQHHHRWDFLFVVGGHLRVVLCDPRPDSPTLGQVDVLHLSPARPMLVAIPPHVWHGVQNLSTEISSFVNFFDRPYDYDDPDEWRLPADTPEIPYRFA